MIFIVNMEKDYRYVWTPLTRPISAPTSNRAENGELKKDAKIAPPISMELTQLTDRRHLANSPEYRKSKIT